MPRSIPKTGDQHRPSRAIARAVARALAGLVLSAVVCAVPASGPPETERPRQYRPSTWSLPDSGGKRFFSQRVLPRLAANGCPLCHVPAAGDVHPAMSYEELLPYLAMGQSPTNNILMLKLANQRSLGPHEPQHIGGQRCGSEDTEPCRTIQQWWHMEFGRNRP